MRESTLVVSVVIVLLLLLRSSAFVFGRAAYFNSDQAIVGLMAKHLSEFREPRQLRWTGRWVST